MDRNKEYKVELELDYNNKWLGIKVDGSYKYENKNL